jgi:probable rRNA maturation factor
MINLQISESLDGSSLALLKDPAFFESAADQALKFARLEQEAELTLVLTDDAQVHELNLNYRQVDAPTDVLSFPAGEMDPDTGNLYLGDIVISVPRAQIQAETEGHSLEAELRLLVVHGVLHLLGYDHANEDEMAMMWSAQSQILSMLGTDGLIPG